MSQWQRIKSFFIGIFLLLFAVVMLTIPEEEYDVITIIIALMMIVYGLRLLFYYGTMAKHMVGGKSILYEAIIILDLGLFTISLSSTVSNPYIILFYLLTIYAFTGVIDILRAFEAKNNGARSWRFKFFSGIVMVVFAILLVVLSIAFKQREILLDGFCISLAYAAIVRIVNAFRKTAIVYIQ